MADRFHVNCDLGPGEILVRGPEAHHLGTVCRVRPGDQVCLFNGDGNEYPARVLEVSKRDVLLEVQAIETPLRERPCSLHLAVPLPKGDRAQFLVEKLTELGVTTLTLLVTDRAVVQPGEAKREKLARYVVEASKQCGRNLLMRIDGPRDWGSFVQDATLPGCRLVAHPRSAGRETRPERGIATVAAVGPEGGWTDAEIAQALEAGWQVVDLGPRILRVETAAVALAVLLGS